MWLLFGSDTAGEPFAGSDNDDTHADAVQGFATGMQRDKDLFTRGAQSLPDLSGGNDLCATAFWCSCWLQEHIFEEFDSR